MRLEMHVKDEILNIIAPNRMKQTMSIYLPPKKKPKTNLSKRFYFLIPIHQWSNHIVRAGLKPRTNCFQLGLRRGYLVSAVQIYTTTHCSFYREQRWAGLVYRLVVHLWLFKVQRQIFHAFSGHCHLV